MTSEVDSEEVSLDIGEGRDPAEDGDTSVMESDFSDDNPPGPPAVNDDNGPDEDRRKNKGSPRGMEESEPEEESLVPVKNRLRSTASLHEDAAQNGARDMEAAGRIVKTERLDTATTRGPAGFGGGHKGTIDDMTFSFKVYSQ